MEYRELRVKRKTEVPTECLTLLGIFFIMGNMENIVLSRAHLETLPSAELIELADELGIDIPENLSRRFIIGELLEIAGDDRYGFGSDIKSDSSADEVAEPFPQAYKDTQISVVLKNPAWAFVYWNIHEDDLAALQNSSAFVSLYLRVAFFSDAECSKPSDSFDISVSISDKAKYVLIPSRDNFLRVDLLAEFKTSSSKTLAFSRRIPLPVLAGKKFQPVPGMRMSPIMELSGFNELLRTHYFNHRHSFL